MSFSPLSSAGSKVVELFCIQAREKDGGEGEARRESVSERQWKIGDGVLLTTQRGGKRKRGGKRGRRAARGGIEGSSDGGPGGLVWRHLSLCALAVGQANAVQCVSLSPEELLPRLSEEELPPSIEASAVTDLEVILACLNASLTAPHTVKGHQTPHLITHHHHTTTSPCTTHHISHRTSHTSHRTARSTHHTSRYIPHMSHPLTHSAHSTHQTPLTTPVHTPT